MSFKSKVKQSSTEVAGSQERQQSLGDEKAPSTKMGSTAVLAMCKPQYFEVSYSINPWMHPPDWKNRMVELRQKAQAGWEEMYQKFLSLGVSVVLVPPEDGLPDMVFTANAGIVLDRKALLSRFRYPERQAEERPFAAFFEDMRHKNIISEVKRLPEEIRQEGAGDCYWDAYRQLFWAGYGPRSSKDAVSYIEEYFGKPVVALKLASDEFYHIDISLCPLSGGQLIYYPEALTTESLATIRDIVPKEFLIPLKIEEAVTFAANAVNLGKQIVMASCSARLEAELNQHGYNIVRVPVETFAMAGGSVFCMTLRLDQGSTMKIGRT